MVEGAYLSNIFEICCCNVWCKFPYRLSSALKFSRPHLLGDISMEFDIFVTMLEAMLDTTEVRIVKLYFKATGNS